MLYRHTPLFQALMQQAVNIAAAAQGLSDRAIVTAARLEISKSTLYRFRNADLREARDDKFKSWPISQLDARYLNLIDARNLWVWLTAKGYIDNAMSDIAWFKKKTLYTHEEVANAMMAFYGSHESQLKKWIKEGIEGEWICYKKSSRMPGFVVKSRVNIENINDNYLEIIDEQRSTGIFEVSGNPVFENSTGFAFSKSYKLWMILREEEAEQPRIMVFTTRRLERGVLPTSPEKITILSGRVLESDLKFRGQTVLDIYYWNVILVKKETDEIIYKSNNQDYNIEEQWDIFPFDDDKVSEYGNKKNCFIPNEIKRALNTGNPVR